MTPFYLNSSALKRSACDQAFVYMCVEGLTNIDNIEALVFGSALHKFAELFKRAQCIDPAQEFMDLALPAYFAALKSYREWNGREEELLKNACLGFEDIESEIGLPLEIDGKPLVENWFDIPYNGVNLCGTLDLIRFDGRTIFLYDYKSSRAWKQDDLFAEYERSTQFPFYAGRLHQFPEQFCSDERFIAAAKAGRIEVRIVACFVNVGKTMPHPKWRIGPAINYPLELLVQYQDLLEQYIPHIVDIYNSGQGMRNGWISDLCRKCPYVRPCHAETPEMAEIMKQNLFVRKPYNPKHYR